MIKGQAPKLPTGQQSEATRVRQSQPFAGAQGGVGGLPPPTRIPKDAWVLVVPALGNKSCGASLQRLSVHHAPDLGSRNMPTMVDPASQVLEPPPNPGRFTIPTRIARPAPPLTSGSVSLEHHGQAITSAPLLRPTKQGRDRGTGGIYP